MQGSVKNLAVSLADSNLLGNLQEEQVFIKKNIIVTIYAYLNENVNEFIYLTS